MPKKYLCPILTGAAVYPPSMVGELEMNVGDFWIDCSRMPTAEELKGKEAEKIDR